MVSKSKTVSVDIVRTWIYVIISLAGLVYYFGIWTSKVDGSVAQTSTSVKAFNELSKKVAVLESTMPTQETMTRLRESQAAMHTDLKHVLRSIDALKNDFKFYIKKE